QRRLAPSRRLASEDKNPGSSENPSIQLLLLLHLAPPLFPFPSPRRSGNRIPLPEPPLLVAVGLGSLRVWAELCRRVFMVLYRISSRRDPGARAADSLSQKDHEGGLLLLFFYANMLFISFFLKKEHRINDCPHGLFTFHFPLRFWISIQILCVEVFVYIVVGVCAKHTYFVVC
ncbi:unnamed protein product, partial [Brassica rapa subsp. trilocularis]